MIDRGPSLLHIYDADDLRIRATASFKLRFASKGLG